MRHALTVCSLNLLPRFLEMHMHRHQQGTTEACALWSLLSVAGENLLLCYIFALLLVISSSSQMPASSSSRILPLAGGTLSICIGSLHLTTKAVMTSPTPSSVASCSCCEVHIFATSTLIYLPSYKRGSKSTYNTQITCMCTSLSRNPIHWPLFL